MADVTKTVSVIFSGDSTQAEEAVNRLSASLEKVGSNAPAQINEVGKALDDVAPAADSAKSKIDEISNSLDKVSSPADSAKTGVGVFTDELMKLSEKAGVPKEAINGVVSALTELGAGSAAAGVVAAATVAAFAYVVAQGAKETGEFATQLRNLTGSSEEGARGVEFIGNAVRKLETDLASTAAIYKDFRFQISASAIDAEQADMAFVGVLNAVKGFTGSIDGAGPALRAYAEIIKDGSISSSELENKLTKIPGALEELQRITGKTVEELKLFAEQGALNKAVIDALTESLYNKQYQSTTPIKDAFTDLINTIKEFGATTGEGGLGAAADWVISKSLRALTVDVAGAAAAFELVGRTIANVTFSLANDRNFENFKDRQSVLFDEITNKLQTSIDKLTGFNEAGTKAGKNVSLEFEVLKDSVGKFPDSINETDKALKALGFDAGKIKDGTDVVVRSFATLATDSKATSEIIISGLLMSLTKVSDPEIIGALGQYAKGALEARGNVEGLTAVNNALSQALDGTLPKFKDNTKAVNEIDNALKDLGLDPKKIIDQTDVVVKAFAILATRSEATSEVIISGLLAALTKVSNPEIIGALGQYAKGALEARGNVEGLTVVNNALSQALDGTLPRFKGTTDQAEKLGLELEKIASNERIKLIEFNFKLNEAEIKAEVERVKIAFESLDDGIKSTGSVISAALGSLNGASGSRFQLIDEVIREEQKLRREQFSLQKDLVREQIERLRAQSEALRKGDALIKIDGAGLAPQLEAFMWAVLRAIQVRVNNDGLPLLLGTQ